MKSLRYFVWAQVAWVILLIPMMVLRYTLPEGSAVQHVFQLITTFSSVVPVSLVALQLFFARGAFKNSTGLATDLAYLGIHDKEHKQKVTGRRVKVSRNRLGSLQYDFLDAPVIKKPLSRFQAFMDYGRFMFASRDDMSSVWVREGRRYTAQGDQTWTRTLTHLRLLTWETIRLEKKLLRQRKLGDSRTGFPLGAYILAGTDKISQLRDPAQRDKIVERALAFYNTEHTPQTVYQTRSLDMDVLREFLDLPTSWMREATSHMIDPDYVLRVSGVRKDAEYA